MTAKKAAPKKPEAKKAVEPTEQSAIPPLSELLKQQKKIDENLQNERLGNIADALNKGSKD